MGNYKTINLTFFLVLCRMTLAVYHPWKENISFELLEKYKDKTLVYIVKDIQTNTGPANLDNPKLFTQVCGGKRCNIEQQYCDRVTDDCASCVNLCLPQRTSDDNVKKDCEERCPTYLTLQSKRYYDQETKQQDELIGTTLSCDNCDNIPKSVYYILIAIIVILVLIVCVLAGMLIKCNCVDNKQKNVSENGQIVQFPTCSQDLNQKDTPPTVVIEQQARVADPHSDEPINTEMHGSTQETTLLLETNSSNTHSSTTQRLVDIQDKQLPNNDQEREIVENPETVTAEIHYHRVTNKNVINANEQSSGFCSGDTNQQTDVKTSLFQQ